MGTNQRTYSDRRKLQNNDGTRSVSIPSGGIDEAEEVFDLDDMDVHVEFDPEQGEGRFEFLD